MTANSETSKTKLSVEIFIMLLKQEEARIK